MYTEFDLPSKCEMAAGGVGRNFVARVLLEAKSIDDALIASLYIDCRLLGIF